MLLGLRPERIIEAKAHPEPGVETFDAVLDVTELMGMKTMIYFPLEGAQICGRVNPNAGVAPAMASRFRLAVDLNSMHLRRHLAGRATLGSRTAAFEFSVKSHLTSSEYSGVTGCSNAKV